MAQIMLAVGIDTRGNPVNLYTDEDFIVAHYVHADKSPIVPQDRWPPWEPFVLGGVCAPAESSAVWLP
jgi:hypothetical protein